MTTQHGALQAVQCVRERKRRTREVKWREAASNTRRSERRRQRRDDNNGDNKCAEVSPGLEKGGRDRRLSLPEW